MLQNRNNSIRTEWTARCTDVELVNRTQAIISFRNCLCEDNKKSNNNNKKKEFKLSSSLPVDVNVCVCSFSLSFSLAPSSYITYGLAIAGLFRVVGIYCYAHCRSSSVFFLSFFFSFVVVATAYDTCEKLYFFFLLRNQWFLFLLFLSTSLASYCVLRWQ